ncbi:hypothetical protein ALC57_16117 [Trachymyrmex cornetzi]|uniref:Uncharacterized protein n=1 Tax=Trachymyrmex cornetzi TaxID=471704 RepID=A0A151IVJ5_9HYME|nr:hypothetical protein ALC57_16117 [Trachymyrmex cornetzi]
MKPGTVLVTVGRPVEEDDLALVPSLITLADIRWPGRTVNSRSPSRHDPRILRHCGSDTTRTICISVSPAPCTNTNTQHKRGIVTNEYKAGRNLITHIGHSLENISDLSRGIHVYDKPRYSLAPAVNHEMINDETKDAACLTSETIHGRYPRTPGGRLLLTQGRQDILMHFFLRRKRKCGKSDGEQFEVSKFNFEEMNR